MYEILSGRCKRSWLERQIESYGYGIQPDDVFRTMVTDCSPLLLPMFNECFHEHYTGRERIVLLQNEHFLKQQDGNEDKRVADSFIVVIDEKGEKKTYHVETQSTPDNSMLVRMFEYGAQLALAGGEKEGNVLTVTFPHAAVLFLRHNEATPEEMLIRMITPGGTVEYSIPVMKVKRYTIDEIFDKKLYFLIPFYIFTHESRFDDYEADESKLAVLLNEYRQIVRKLEQLQEAGELDAFTRQAIIDMGKKVVRHLAIDKKKIVEGVEDIMGGKILDYEAKDILNKGRNEGRLEGRAEGRAEGIVLGQTQMLTQLVLSKLKKHKSPEEIADALEISEEKMLDIARANGFAI